MLARSAPLFFRKLFLSLLSSRHSAGEVETDRFKAVRALQQKYGGVVLLKGSGTLVCGSDQVVHVIGEGNPGMASGGMGDLLTGIITGQQIFLFLGLSWCPGF